MCWTNWVDKVILFLLFFFFHFSRSSFSVSFFSLWAVAGSLPGQVSQCWVLIAELHPRPAFLLHIQATRGEETLPKIYSSSCSWIAPHSIVKLSLVDDNMLCLQRSRDRASKNRAECVSSSNFPVKSRKYSKVCFVSMQDVWRQDIKKINSRNNGSFIWLSGSDTSFKVIWYFDWCRFGWKLPQFH